MFHAPSTYALPVCRIIRCLLVSLAMATPFYAVHLLIEDYKCLVTIAFIKILYFLWAQLSQSHMVTAFCAGRLMIGDYKHLMQTRSILFIISKPKLLAHNSLAMTSLSVSTVIMNNQESG